MTELFLNIIGWAGVAILLIAYWLVSTGRYQGDSVRYQVLNILGACMLIVNSFYFGAYPSVGVNIAWVGIALYSLIRISKSIKNTPPLN